MRILLLLLICLGAPKVQAQFNRHRLPFRCSAPLYAWMQQPPAAPDSAVCLLALVRRPDWWLKRYPECRLLHQSDNLLLVSVPAGSVAKVCTDELLLKAEWGHPVAAPEQPVPNHNLSVNHIALAHAQFPNLSGSDITLSIKEYRVESNDIDLKGRLLPVTNTLIANDIHATIMASLAAGGGNTDPAGKGVAPAARVYSSSFAGLTPDPDSTYQRWPITVQNHSYGVEIEPFYGILANAYDRTTQTHPALVHVFSSGNKGFEASASGPYSGIKGYGTLSGNFKMAKNVLVVGSVDSFDRVVPFSSRGPAYDGRIKPDLSAYGPDGSSGAAALVSGAAAVLQQLWLERYDTLPRSELVKAILIGSADDIETPGPDFLTGFGNLNLYKAIQMVQDNRFQEGRVEQQTEQTITIQVPPGAGRAIFTLHWNDTPAAVNAALALNNDLDLTVQSPDGQVWRPLVLQTAADSALLAQPAVQGVDSLNTTEQVTIPAPQPGAYTVVIHPLNLTAPDQTFCLTWLHDDAQRVVWSHPVRGTAVVSNASCLLRWQTEASTGNLYWKPVADTEWQPIATGIDLSKGYFRWYAPDVVAPAQVRIQTPAQTIDSDTFMIAPVLDPAIELNCRDSLLLTWDQLPLQSGQRYQVWGLGDRYLEPLFETTDTAVVVYKSQWPQQVFAVSLETDAAAAPTATAPQINYNANACYIESLIATCDEPNQRIAIRLNIGSLYGVNSVLIERLGPSGWQTIKEWPPQGDAYDATDNQPLPAGNRYRARLLLTGQREVVSDTAVVYCPIGRPLLVWPNPVKTGQSVYIVAGEDLIGARWRLFNAAGQLVFETALENTLTEWPVKGGSGVYFWKAGEQVGKVVVE